MRKRIYWILPVVVMIAGVVSLILQNLNDATQPPEEGWSRALPIGTTILNKAPAIKETDDGNFIVQSYEDDELIAKTFNEKFELLQEEEITIPVTKWTQVYFGDEAVLYHDNYHIYDQNQEKIVSDATQFYPLNDSVLYIKENTLFKLDPDKKESAELMELPTNIEEITPYEGEDGLYVMTHKSENNVLSAVIYEISNEKVSQVHEGELVLDPGHTAEQMTFAVHDDEVALIIQAVQRSTQGSPDFFTYMAETKQGEFHDDALTKLTFNDPAGNSQLQEVSKVSIRFNGENSSVIFQANGFSQTKFKENRAFNIYSATIEDGKILETHRKSNTPGISNKPVWLNNDTVAWLEVDGKEYTMYISSGKDFLIEKASGITSDDWLHVLGKVGGMLSISLLAILISGIWYIWPILFIVGMYFWKDRIVERDPTWIFYTGIGIYLGAVLLFKDQFFVSAIFTNSPAYLAFPGSSYVYITLFAIIALIAAQSTKQTKQWGGTARISYFVGAHILMITAVFGPYLTPF